jgi:cholest-4-en-3-one 26-monooxygenase
MFALLRKVDPVHWQAEDPKDTRADVKPVGYWAITKYEDVVHISRHPQLFSSALGGTNISDLPPDELTTIRLMMLNMDPPQHVKLRRLVKSGFTPKVIEGMQPFIESAVAKCIDAVIDRSAYDFVESISSEIPLVLICDILGVPQEDRRKIFDWSNSLIGFDDPEYPNAGDEALQVSMQLVGYALQLAKHKKAKVHDDIASILIHAEVEGEKLTDMEFGLFMMLLSVAGNETTRNAMTGGMIAMLENPEQWELFKSDPEKYADGATEEIVRWVSPVMYFRRTATQDVELRGKTIKANDKVVMYYGSANRDEDVFDQPHRFDITRDPNPQIAFGTGEHFCLGSKLARMEIRTLFVELAKRMPDIRMAGPVDRLRSNFINGVKRMPVTFPADRRHVSNAA